MHIIPMNRAFGWFLILLPFVSKISTYYVLSHEHFHTKRNHQTQKIMHNAGHTGATSGTGSIGQTTRSSFWLWYTRSNSGCRRSHTSMHRASWTYKRPRLISRLWGGSTTRLSTGMLSITFLCGSRDLLFWSMQTRSACVCVCVCAHGFVWYVVALVFVVHVLCRKHCTNAHPKFVAKIAYKQIYPDMHIHIDT